MPLGSRRTDSSDDPYRQALDQRATNLNRSLAIVTAFASVLAVLTTLVLGLQVVNVLAFMEQAREVDKQATDVDKRAAEVNEAHGQVVDTVNAIDLIHAEMATKQASFDELLNETIGNRTLSDDVARASESETSDTAEAAAAELRDLAPFLFLLAGYEIDGRTETDSLRSGENDQFPVELEPGREYRFAGTCDEDCGDLDLALLSGSGTEASIIEEDILLDDWPLVDYSPSGEETVTVEVRMKNCEAESEDGCKWEVRQYSRATEAVEEDG